MRVLEEGRAILDTLSMPRVVNLALLIAYPAAWLAPLAEAGVVSWWSGKDITIFRGVVDLWAVDPALSILVAVLAVLIPYAKTVMIAAIQFGRLGPAALPWLEGIGKLSMADVFLIALYVVVVKGVGFGHVTTSWGLWLFTACVLASMWAGWATKRALVDAREEAA